MANKEKEQIVKLKDGRTIFKTHNGFKYFVTTKKETIEVSESYYKQALKNKVKYDNNPS